MSAPRLTVDDLEFLVDWCGEGYEGEDDDENVIRARRCAAWATAELARRREDSLITGIIAGVKGNTGRTVTRAQARKALREQAASRQSGATS